MARFFNTTTPCDPERHYTLPPEARLVRAPLDRYIKDPRIRQIVEVIITGEINPLIAEGDDFRLALDLGLVTMEGGNPEIANPIYRETIARILSQGMQAAIPPPEFPWRKPNGALNMDELLRQFQKFWRRHSEAWENKTGYTEAFPHLLLMLTSWYLIVPRRPEDLPGRVASTGKIGSMKENL
jgi:hypothetical protein